MTVRPAKTQISLGIRPVWSESLLCPEWVAKGPSFLHADSQDSDQTGRMPRLIWVFAGHTVILLVLSWGGSIILLYSGIRQLLYILHSEQCFKYTCENNKRCLTCVECSFWLSFQIGIWFPHLSLIMRNPVFGISDQVRLKLACSAKETC